MKVNRVKLAQFSSHTETSIALKDKVNVIVGQMNAGKSSIAQAIEIGLTGQCEFYRKKTDNALELIHDAGDERASRFSIELDLSDMNSGAKGKLRRGRSTAAKEEFIAWGEESESAAMTRGYLQRDVGVPPGVLSAMLHTTTFLEMEVKAQREFILSLIGAEVSHKLIKREFDEFGGDPESLKMLPLDVESLSDIDKAYDWAYKERTGINRALKELRPMEPKEGDQPNLEAIRSKLDSLEEEEKRVIAELSAAKARTGTADKKFVANLESERQALEEWLGKHKDPSRDELKSLVTRLEQAENEASNWLAKKNLARRNLEEVKAKLAVAESNVKLLDNFNGLCVAGNHECPVPKEHMDIARDSQERTAETAATTIAKLEAEYQAAEEKADVSGIRMEIERDRDRLNMRKELRDEKARRLTEVKKTLSDIGDPEEDEDAKEKVIALEETLEALKVRIRKGRELWDGANEWVSYNRRVHQVADQRRELEVQSRRIESLVEFFGPKGVKAKLVDQKISEFEGSINKDLKAFGFSMKFQTDPWRVIARGRAGERLSRSERFRLGVALQIAMAVATGVKFVLIDNAELLTVQARQAMLKMLMKAPIDQAVVIITLMVSDEEFRKSVPDVSGLGFYLVTNRDGVSTIKRVAPKK